MKKALDNRIGVGVFFGGRSVEHEVSVISGLQAYFALDTERYAPVAVYITKEGTFYTGEKITDVKAYGDVKSLLAESTRVNLVSDGGRFYLVRYPEKKFGDNILAEIEVAFPVVHGTNVEDGTLQGFFKSVGIPFVGCDVTASAVGMDKALTKAVLKMHGVPVLDCLCFNDKEYAAAPDDALKRIEETLRYPLIVKPVNLGSSVGIRKVKDREALRAALEDAFAYAPVVLAENAVEHLKEINCAVLGDRYEAIPSVTESPVGSDDILDFGDKYLKGRKGGKTGAKTASGSKGAGMANLSRIIPADVPADVEAKVKDYAVRAFKAIGCAGVTRIDFLYNTETGELYLNELNTIPGSLAFYLWEPAGIPFVELVDRLVKLALKRNREEGELNFTFDSNILKGITLGRGTKGGGKA